MRRAADHPERWDLADPGYLVALLPAPVAFEIEAILTGPHAEQDAPVEAIARMSDPTGTSLVAAQPMRWRWMAGTVGVTWKRRLFLPASLEFDVPGIYTIGVQLEGAAPVERGFRVRVET